MVSVPPIRSEIRSHFLHIFWYATQVLAGDVLSLFFAPPALIVVAVGAGFVVVVLLFAIALSYTRARVIEIAPVTIGNAPTVLYASASVRWSNPLSLFG